MYINRLGAEVEALRDSLGRLSLSDELKNFKLEVRELFDGRVVPTASREVVEGFCAHSFTQINLSTENSADRFEHFFSPRFLHEIAATAGPERAFGVE